MNATPNQDNEKWGSLSSRIAIAACDETWWQTKLLLRELQVCRKREWPQHLCWLALEMHSCLQSYCWCCSEMCHMPVSPRGLNGSTSRNHIRWCWNSVDCVPPPNDCHQEVHRSRSYPSYSTHPWSDRISTETPPFGKLMKKMLFRNKRWLIDFSISPAIICQQAESTIKLCYYSRDASACCTLKRGI